MFFWFLLFTVELVEFSQSVNFVKLCSIIQEINIKVTDDQNCEYTNESRFLDDFACKQNTSEKNDHSCIFLNFAWRNDVETEKNCTIIAESNTVPPKSFKGCEWSTFNNDSCLNILLDTLKNACPGFKLAGEFFAVKLKCYSHNTIDLNSEFCVLFTLQKEILKGNEYFIQRIEKGTNFLNASFLSLDYSAKQPTSLGHYTRQPSFVENKKAIKENEIKNTTQTNNKSMLNKNVVTFVVLGCGVMLFLLIVAFYFICSLSKRSKDRKMTIESAQLSCTGDVAEIKMEELYAFPNKKKFKFKYRLHKNRGQWKGYDTVNSVIPGTYKEHNLKGDSCEKSLYANTFNTSPKAIHSSPILGEDVPFKRIVGRSSFTPKRFPFPKDGIPINEETLKESKKNFDFDQELLESEGNIKEDQLKNNFNVESKNCLLNGNNTPGASVQNENVSFFKPGSSVRIKQQRTSRRNGNEGKNNLSMRELVHEDVSITPLITKRISPDLNDSRVNSDEANNSFKKKSPAVPKRTSSIKNVKQINENVFKNSPKIEQKTNGIEMSDSMKVEISFQNSSEVEIKADINEIITKAEVEPLFEPEYKKSTNNHDTDKSFIKDD